jgi:uncharacterized protein
VKKNSFLKRLVFIIFLVYIGFGLALFVFQNNFIYYPDQTEFTDCTYLAKAEKITFGSTRMYFTDNSSDKVIVFYHGNAGRACDRDYMELFFAEQGYSTLFVEYAGYSEKVNSPSMNKILENVLDTINFLKTKEFTEVFVSGESLGVGPATYHASLATVQNIILITAYDNFSNVVSSHYPVYPVSLLLKNNYTPDKWLGDYKGPISIILAQNDEVIPNKLGQKLYEGLLSKEKYLSIINDVGHNTIYNSSDFYTALKNALK